MAQADYICPTFASGTNSLITGKSSVTEFNNDAAVPGQPNGYAFTYPSITVGSFNNGWTNGDLTQTVLPVYRNGLNSFGNTGLQS